MKLSKYVGGKAVIVYDELLMYKEFKALERSAHGFIPVFNYIYLIADSRSHPNKQGMNATDAKDYAIKNSGVPSTFKEDAMVRAAIAKYKELSQDPLRETAKVLRKILNQTHYLALQINDAIEVVLQSKEVNPDTAKEAIQLTDRAFDMCAKSVNYLKILSDIEEKIELDELTGVTIARGGNIVEDSMRPDNAIDNASMDASETQM